jgi:hypothetical protein
MPDAAARTAVCPPGSGRSRGPWGRGHHFSKSRIEGVAHRTDAITTLDVRSGSVLVVAAVVSPLHRNSLGGPRRRALLRRVLAFCELDENEEVLRVFDRTHQPGLAHGRRADADPADVDRILRWTEATMGLIGYEPS